MMPRKNTVHRYFDGTDTEELFKHNLRENYKQLQQNGWDENSVIDYKIDSNGFRNDTDEIPKDSIMILGCSFAMGIGLRREQTFGHMISKKLNLPYLNYAHQGSGMLSSFYIANKFIPIVKPKHIFYLRPDDNRVDIYNSNQPCYSKPLSVLNLPTNTRKVERWRSKTNNRSFEYNWVLNDEWRNQIVELTNIAITKLAEDHNATLVIHYANEDEPTSSKNKELELWDKGQKSKARDLMHDGEEMHKYWAYKFLEPLGIK